jgi:hypothetical protein
MAFSVGANAEPAEKGILARPLVTMCFYVSWPILLVLVNSQKGELYSTFGFLCTAMFVCRSFTRISELYYRTLATDAALYEATQYVFSSFESSWMPTLGCYYCDCH